MVAVNIGGCPTYGAGELFDLSAFEVDVEIGSGVHLQASQGVESMGRTVLFGSLRMVLIAVAAPRTAGFFAQRAHN